MTKRRLNRHVAGDNRRNDGKKRKRKKGQTLTIALTEKSLFIYSTLCVRHESREEEYEEKEVEYYADTVLRLSHMFEQKGKTKIHRIDVKCNTFYKVTEHFIL